MNRDRGSHPGEIGVKFEIGYREREAIGMAGDASNSGRCKV